ncbi:NUDIX hydrolase [Streptomyces sp. IB2014 016-6]|uniref:NUDIX hydrolase n=1 Tax=Streptomyces sp. IB2014 016-6 TaxID=2517818 RepID=UPI0011C8F5E5|nr:NUDIX hydrolase [Streptomyces sp. IB2014 016-6]TXL87132.1 NUDIX hydrolase [Streptomyces sp. IB2014 016-6]
MSESTGARARTVLAAGCVLWRKSPYSADGSEICLVHRPKWADWSHPKGKLKRGETFADAAIREVHEETGMTCALGSVLPTARYLALGTPKEVRYWAAEATGGAFVASKEVDRILWLTPAAAHERLTHERDKELVTVFLDILRSVGS